MDESVVLLEYNSKLHWVDLSISIHQPIEAKFSFESTMVFVVLGED